MSHTVGTKIDTFSETIISLDAANSTPARKSSTGFSTPVVKRSKESTARQRRLAFNKRGLSNKLRNSASSIADP